TYSKTPTCPDTFTWRGEDYRVAEMLVSWVDYERRGKMARNMQPQHARVAEKRGSWGVGRFFFQVKVDDGRIFEFYYDRAPKDADQRLGSWMLTAELCENGDV
ncbi:MAG: DUF6504 family protein, partial [Anaerolineaceae bacterium]|nr:DUF6504 family protein [Anaerolineaceae bacterium]